MENLESKEKTMEQNRFHYETSNTSIEDPGRVWMHSLVAIWNHSFSQVHQTLTQGFTCVALKAS